MVNLFHEAKKILDKDGKVNPLGPYGKQKLTGREISTYFRRNPVKDPELKKAVSVALDLGGADTIARKEIARHYGSKMLKAKEVQQALQYANEETVSEKFKPYMPKGYERVTDLYIQFRGDEKQSKKDFEQAKKIVSAYSKKHKLDIRDNPRNQVFGSPEQGSSAYKVSIFAKFTKDANHDLAPLYTELSKLKTAEDHGGGNAKPITENYRVLAKHGMGAETKNSIKVGTEIDYYRGDGAKYMGKVIKMTPKGYIVKDDKNGKNYQFTYHDRKKGAKLLNQGDAEDKAKLNLKHVQDMEKLKDKQTREKENMSEHKNILDAYKEMWENGVKYAPIDFEKDVELLESLLLNEVSDKEINAMKKLSKDMQKVLKDYQKIATMGDKELKDTKHNAAYKKVLDARDTVLTMIGTLQTRQTIEKSMRKESVMDAYKKMHETTLKEEMITYRVKKMQKPEEQKFIRSAKMMGLKITMNKGKDDTLIVMSGTKKKLRDFDSIARGKSSFGDPSTVKHFDEK